MENPAVASVSLASILENSVTQPQISEWLSSPTRDFQARLVHLSRPSPSSDGLDRDSDLLSFYPSSPTKPPPSLRSSSSMAPACIHQSSTASTHPPSLYNYSEATPTETSISTGLASRFSGVPLLEENNGVLEQRQNDIRSPVFECCFWFLNCSYLSLDEEEWRTHCLSHFRGEEPPKSVKCPLCEDFEYTNLDGWHSWDRRMDHVAYHHSVLGETLRTSRPDFHLFQHLWQKRLIDDADLKELKGGNHNLTRQPNNFTVTNGRRGRDGRDGRGQRHQHIGTAARRPARPNLYRPATETS